MNRRRFFGLFAAAPLVATVPAPAKASLVHSPKTAAQVYNYVRGNGAWMVPINLRRVTVRVVAWGSCKQDAERAAEEQGIA